MTKYKAIVIGAGSIGALKPDQFDSPESKQIYTHAHACYSHQSIELVGILDIDKNKAFKAADKWNSIPYNDVSHFYYEGREHPSTINQADIAIVAVNTEHHYDTIHQLIPFKPKVIICEKPFCMNYEQAKTASELCADAGIKLIINYQRSFTPELKQLSDDLRNGVYGLVYNFTLRYSRGLLREASHAFYWCLQTFGKLGIRHIEDYAFYDSPTPDDYTADVYYNWPGVIFPFIHFIPIGSMYSTYNADIYTEKGRIELLNNWKTIRYHENAQSTYGNYPATGLLFTDKTAQLDQALTFLLDHAIKAIERNDISIDVYALELHKRLRPRR